jgi:hypothetical protein
MATFSARLQINRGPIDEFGMEKPIFRGPGL